MVKVCVLYNTDYDAELTAAEGVDVSAVEASARAVLDGVKDAGHDAILVGSQGDDVRSVLPQLLEVDLVFNLCESLSGQARNEVVYPALMDLNNVPYTGSDAFTLALCLHKDRCNPYLKGRGLKTPPGHIFRTERDIPEDELDCTMFLKLAREDASIGIDASNVVSTREQLITRAGQLVEKYDQPVIAERFISGRELNVTLLYRNGAWEVMPMYEIDFSKMPKNRPHIISYAGKWDESHIDYGGSMPVPVVDMPPEVEKRVKRAAIEAAEVCGMRDYGRVDFRVDESGIPWCIDVNPNCDITPGAGFANSAAAAGLDYAALLNVICLSALARKKT